MFKKFLIYDPAVFTVGNEYCISARVGKDCAFAVDIGGKRYFDHINGVVRTDTRIHRVNVPQNELDKAKHYTAVIIPLIKRLDYESRFGSEIKYEYDFSPVPEKDVNIYHISDTHGNSDHAILSAQNFGKKIDLLILNGDIVNSSERVSDFDTIYRLTHSITHGSIPVICSRGNHDLRGKAAEKIGEYIPTVNGNTYYTLRAGNIWALVLDTGEDKPDDHEEYGGAVWCHPFRVRQTEYIKSVIENADNEYNAPGVEHKFIIAHNPFTYLNNPPFDIEQDMFREWTKLLREQVKPELFFAGHVHACFISEPGGKFDTFGQPCPVIVGSKPDGKNAFTGCGVTLGGDKPEIDFYRG